MASRFRANNFITANLSTDEHFLIYVKVNFLRLCVYLGLKIYLLTID